MLAMLVIRKEQNETMERAAEEAFLLEAVEHLRKYDPARATTGGEEGLREAAALGLIKAREHGYLGRNSVLLVMELMAAFGCHFDDDPLFGWFRPLFTDREGMPELDRTQRLRWHSISYLDRVYGVRGEWGREVLERAALLDMEGARKATLEYGASPVKFLRWLHPQKHDFVGEQVAGEIWKRAANAAKVLGVNSPEGAMFTGALMFAFGHRVFEDPLYARMCKVLKEPAGMEHGQELPTMLGRLNAYLKQMLGRSAPPPTAV